MAIVRRIGVLPCALFAGQHEPENVYIPAVGKLPVVDESPVVGHGTAPPSVESGAEGFTARTSGGGLSPPTPNSVDPNGIPTRATDEGWPIPVGEEAEAAGPATEPLAAVAQVPDTVPAMPPPSKTVLEPDDVPTIPDIPGVDIAVPEKACGFEPAMVEHDKLPPMPGTRGDVPDVIGLTPGDASSVAPSGIPVGATGDAGPIPSGDVMPSGDAPIPPTWAAAGPQPTSTAPKTTINKRDI